VEDVLDLLALLAKKHNIYFLLRPNLIDEKDNIFCECAFASDSEYLEKEAKYQGVSLNQLTNYLLNLQVTQLETISLLESRLPRKSASTLKRKVGRILNQIPERSVPDWDSKI
jgi:hypothetical protein